MFCPDRFDVAGLCEKTIGLQDINLGPLMADEPDEDYTKPIIVLLGPRCYSACDSFVHFLSQFSAITIIGRNPNGSLTYPLNWGHIYDYPELDESVEMWFPAVAPYLSLDKRQWPGQLPR